MGYLGGGFNGFNHSVSEFFYFKKCDKIQFNPHIQTPPRKFVLATPLNHMSDNEEEEAVTSSQGV